MREFFALPPLAAVALLVVNDHLLKARFHNALTGKLSDFAGCFFLPLHVSALLCIVTRLPPQHRLTIGAAVTSVLFVSVSVSPQAAHAVCAFCAWLTSPFGDFHFRIASDATDLVALPLVAVAVWYGLAVSRRPVVVSP